MKQKTYTFLWMDADFNITFSNKYSFSNLKQAKQHAKTLLAYANDDTKTIKIVIA